jgi:hypothetical protein
MNPKPGKSLRFLPVIEFILSILLSFFCVVFRKNQGMTASLTILYIILPILILQLFIMLNYYILKQGRIKTILMVIQSIVVLVLLIFTVINILR